VVVFLSVLAAQTDPRFWQEIRRTEGGANAIARLGLADFLRLRNATDVVVLDARSAVEYGDAHVPGAVWSGSALETTRAGQRVVIYCRSRHCLAAYSEALRLAAKGVVVEGIYTGGWEEWIACGLPLVRK
jgi:rhodanese-related sulfurtransferase